MENYQSEAEYRAKVMAKVHRANVGRQTE